MGHSIGDLIAAYRHHAAEHGVATAAGDYKKGDAHRDRLTDVLGFLRQRDGEGDDALLDVLHDDNPSVRAWAATHSLTVDEAQARAAYSTGTGSQVVPRGPSTGRVPSGQAVQVVPRGPSTGRVPAGQPGTQVVPSLPSTTWLPSGQQVDPRLVSILVVPAGQPQVGPSVVPGGQHFEPRGVSTLLVPSGQPPQGFGVTVTVLVLALEGDA